MKKVIIIGKLNSVTRQINEALSNFCRVQICADNQTVASDMLRLLEPDLVVVSLVGITGENEGIFGILSKEAARTPVIVLGTDENRRRLMADGLMDTRRLHFLHRPLKLDEMMDTAKKLLSVEETGREPENLKKVLVIDDSPLLLRTMQSMLESKYSVRLAVSGSQALMSISKSKPDIIFLDYDMPVCDGRMVLQMLRADETTRDIPVVFLTGISDPAHVREVLSMHPQGYLLKPPAEDKILATIRNLLEEKDRQPASS